jgi:hypothetical protein
MLRGEIAKAENRRCGLGRGVALRLPGRGGKYDQRERKNGSESLQFSLLTAVPDGRKSLHYYMGCFDFPQVRMHFRYPGRHARKTNRTTIIMGRIA